MNFFGSVHPKGRFIVGFHKPRYQVKTLEKGDSILVLGHYKDGTPVDNIRNFPRGDIKVDPAQPVYEILNPLPFLGATYVLKFPADAFKKNPMAWTFKKLYQDQEKDPFEVLLAEGLFNGYGSRIDLRDLPRHVLVSLAGNSKNPKVLAELARISCHLEFDHDGAPSGLMFERTEDGSCRPWIVDKELFEVVVNNPFLPDSFKQVMVLNPGVQGASPIVGEYKKGKTHVWEYLRENSYIPWGHYASNMAQDAVRYNVKDLTEEDMTGLRHLYYQRVYVQMAASLGLGPRKSSFLERDALEDLRQEVLSKVKEKVAAGEPLFFNGSLWGWNYGYGYASSGYRLHASHQQIHNQYALLPRLAGENSPSYAIGDQIRDFISRYEKEFKRPFFDAYLDAIQSNKRTDQDPRAPQGLIIFEDENIMAFCPKAQRSQGEVQILVKWPVGNILEAGIDIRKSLDKGILRVMKALSSMGAEMITVYEASKRFDDPSQSQRLLYCFLPRHEDSPGCMSEAQGRWITGHYPEDFAKAVEMRLPSPKMA